MVFIGMRMNIMIDLLKIFNFLKQNRIKIVFILQVSFVVNMLILPNSYEEISLYGTIIIICLFLVISYI